MRRAIRNHLGSSEVARVIYGAIIGLALVVALEAHPPAAWIVVVTLVGTAIAVALAELYSEVIGTEIRTRRRVSRSALGPMRRGVVAVACGVSFPAVFFALAAVGAFTEATAFTVAKWSGLGLIVLYGFAGARLAGARPHAALVHGLAVGSVGGALIALKALVH